MNNETTDKVEEVKDAAAEKVVEAKEGVAAVAENVKDTAGDIAEKVAEGAKDALGAVGGFLGKAGEAAKNLAENVTKKDLDGDGKVGG
jgi:hypothetical protein